MKKLILILPFLLIALNVSAADLSGCWEVDIQGIDSFGNYVPQNNYIRIIDEGDGLFWGWVCNNPDPAEDGMHFSGVKDGKDLYITHWDSFTKGTMKGKNEFSGVNQAVDEGPIRESTTSLATAYRMDDVQCGVCEPYTCDNGLLDPGEDDIDCGGYCLPCP